MNEQKADDLKAKPSEFYKTFRPFLSDKKQPASEIHIKTNGRIENWGYDSISPRMLRLASSGISDSLTKLFNECIRKGNGLKHGRKESGTQSTKRMTGWMKETIVQ